jgi:hypothetical protein
MSNTPPADINPQTGDPVTIVDNAQRHEQQHQPRPEWGTETANRDAARENGNRTVRIADLAVQHQAEATRERENRTRYEDGLQVLRWLRSAPLSERSLEIDRVLHDRHGSLVPERIDEYIGLLLSGSTSLSARQAMLARHSRHAVLAEATLRTVAEAREVAANWHRLAEEPRPWVHEDGSGPQPALPPSPAAPERLPKREPGAAMKAPPETPAEQTGQLARRAIEELLKAGEDTSVSEAALASRYPEAAPAFGPAPDPDFSATTVRVGDTHVMPAVEGDAEEAESKLPFSMAANIAAPEKPARPASVAKGKPRGAAGSAGDDGDA